MCHACGEDLAVDGRLAESVDCGVCGATNPVAAEPSVATTGEVPATDFLATPLRRRILFALLYASEGAPIGFLWVALLTWMRLDGVPIGRITMLSALLVVPWTFKFAWAPLVDLLRSSRWTLKEWIITAQSIMGLTLLPLFWLDLVADFDVILPLLIVHAVAAATQDVAIDSLCISVTDPTERGRLNGWMQTGMLGGRAMFGGGALLMSAYIGTDAVIALLITVVCGSMVLVATSRLPPWSDDGTPLARRAGTVGRNVLAALREPSTWAGLAFALLGGAAFKSLEVVVGPYLVDRDYSEKQIGLFTAGPMILAMIAGSLTGGWLADRLERRTFVAIALLAFVLPIAGLAATDAAFGSGPHLLVLLTLTALGIGLFTAASYALFMDLTRPEVAATQFSAYMGATNGCESWSSFTIGRTIAASSYATGMLAMCGASLLALPLLLLMHPRSQTEATDSETSDAMGARDG